MYHDPVLLNESVKGLNVKADGRYVDATFGGGGHSKEILKRLGVNGRLLAFDQDEDAIAQVPEDSRLLFERANFRYLERFVRYYDWESVDGILADLGLSSHQLDVPERGFSYRHDTPLDMRMHGGISEMAADLLRTCTEEELHDIFSSYGEVRNARTLAKKIVQYRQQRPITRTDQLVELAESVLRGKRNRYLAQVFQALRIAVNDEVNALKAFLSSAVDVLGVGGRLVVISYHSIEDRLVKQTIKTGNPEGKVIKDTYGTIYRPMKAVNKDVIKPSKDEIKRNPRARSAKLRIAEKTNNSTP